MDGEFYKFKKSAQKEVNYLVKEFEMKKSAGAYARATTARTRSVLIQQNFIPTSIVRIFFKKLHTTRR